MVALDGGTGALAGKNVALAGALAEKNVALAFGSCNILLGSCTGSCNILSGLCTSAPVSCNNLYVALQGVQHCFNIMQVADLRWLITKKFGKKSNFL